MDRRISYQLITNILLVFLSSGIVLAGKMPPARAPLVEKFGMLDLPLGGKNGYVGVRGGQGPRKDKFQGYTPRKSKGPLHDQLRHGAGGCHCAGR